MSTQLTISITKQVLELSKHCGRTNDLREIGENCAIAIALADIFPRVFVTGYDIFPFGIDGDNKSNIRIPLPAIARQFIKLFDGFYLTPKLRLLLPEFEFNVDIPDEVIEQINIEEVREMLKVINQKELAVR